MPQDRPVLRVEGKDDKFVIENLLSRHGIDRALVDIKWSERGERDDAGGKDALLEGMRLAVTTSTGKAVAFVLDADETPEERWRGVRTRLGDVLALPDEIPEDGFVGDAESLPSQHAISGTIVRPRLPSSNGPAGCSYPQRPEPADSASCLPWASRCSGRG